MIGNKRNDLAFSIAELLIVCAIILVVATIVSVAIIGLRRTANVSICSVRMSRIHQGLMAYMADYGNSPGFLGDMYAMGLPPEFADVSRPEKGIFPYAGVLEDWMCPEPKPAERNWMPHRAYVPRPEESGLGFADHAIRLRGDTPLVVDLNHNDFTKVGLFEPQLKRILYLNLGGAVINKQVRRPYYPGDVNFFEIE